MDVIQEDEDWVVIAPSPDSPRLAFQEAQNLRQSEWPNPDRPQQFHLDLMVEDIDHADEQVLKLGAKRLDGEGEGFRVYADPAGHPFCLCWQE